MQVQGHLLHLYLLERQTDKLHHSPKEILQSQSHRSRVHSIHTHTHTHTHTNGEITDRSTSEHCCKRSAHFVTLVMLTRNLLPIGPISGHAARALWVGRRTAVSPKEGVRLFWHLADCSDPMLSSHGDLSAISKSSPYHIVHQHDEIASYTDTSAMITSYINIHPKWIYTVVGPVMDPVAF